MHNGDDALPKVLAGLLLLFLLLCVLPLPGCDAVLAEEHQRTTAALVFFTSLFFLVGLLRAVRGGGLRPIRVMADPPRRPPIDQHPLRVSIAEQERSRTPENHPPQPEELLRLISGRLCGMSLREVCSALWPSLRWQPLLSGDDSAAERVRACGKTAAQLVHAQMMALVRRGSVSLSLSQHEEVEAQAAIVYEAQRQKGARHE